MLTGRHFLPHLLSVPAFPLFLKHRPEMNQFQHRFSDITMTTVCLYYRYTTNLCFCPAFREAGQSRLILENIAGTKNIKTNHSGEFLRT